jgi:hypothetical protein
VNEARIRGGQDSGAESEFLKCAGSERVDDDVGGSHEAQKNVATRAALEVDRNRPLVAVERVKRPRERARQGWHEAQVVTAVWVFDLDDLGAEVGEGERAKRSRKEPREIDDSGA